MKRLTFLGLLFAPLVGAFPKNWFNSNKTLCLRITCSDAVVSVNDPILNCAIELLHYNKEVLNGEHLKKLERTLSIPTIWAEKDPQFYGEMKSKMDAAIRDAKIRGQELRKHTSNQLVKVDLSGYKTVKNWKNQTGFYRQLSDYEFEVLVAV